MGGTDSKEKKDGECLYNSYEADESRLRTLKILKYEEPSVEWLKFVSGNRKGTVAGADFDIIAGPVANDRTMPVISLYFFGIYDEEETIRRLLPQKLKDQYAFKTDKALAVLSVEEEVKLR